MSSRTKGTTHKMMRTSHLLIYPLHLQRNTYKDPSLELMPSNLTIRYFRFLELFLIYMRIWCCLNQICLLLLGMMDLAWMRRTSIGAWSHMEEMAASTWGLKMTPQVEISVLWSHHNAAKDAWTNFTSFYIIFFVQGLFLVLRHLILWARPMHFRNRPFRDFYEAVWVEEGPSRCVFGQP